MSPTIRLPQHFVDTILDGYWVVSAQRTLLEVNDAYCRMSGYSCQQLLGMPVANLEVESLDAPSQAARMATLRSGQVLRFESAHRHRDGSSFEVEVSAWFDAQSDTFQGFIRDLTPYRAVEHALREEHAHLIEAEHIGRFISWEQRVGETMLHVSARLREFYFLPDDAGELSLAHLLARVHPQDRAWVSQAHAHPVCGENVPLVYRVCGPLGEPRWLEQRMHCDFDAAGRATRVRAIVQDVSERERLLDEVRIAAVAFETQEAIIVTDSEVNIVRVNPAFERITGYTEQEVLGKNPRLLASGRHDRAFYAQMWDALRNTGEWSGEIWDRRKDGEIYPKWMTLSAVRRDGLITHYVAVFVDISERKKVEDEIRNLAFYDALTHLPNRRLLQDRMRQALVQSTRSGQYGALMFLDMDHFKVLNDTKGHQYGDRLLVEVAARLQSAVRETDTVARFGGDEFVLLLEDLPAEKTAASTLAAQIAEKIRSAVADPYDLGEVIHRSSPSIGVVMFRGGGEPAEELLKQADLAMYQAKGKGRNLVCFFEASMQALIESRALLENALRQALERDELSLHYQLQTDSTRTLLGAEVLLRWNSPTLGMVPPVQFIPLAEQTKLILPIGHWVLENACRQIKKWSSDPLMERLNLAVNISPVQFHQADFVAQVQAILQATGADPRRLELELTENLVLEDIKEATRKMSALREIGVRFSMDDFGTGYSSLQYIKRLPIDLLKIDQSFVRDILTDPGDAMMVQTIAGMAHNFGFGVIAEGVEEREQIDSLMARGCSKFQGYLFSRPVSLAEFEKLVAQWQTA